MVFSSVKYRWLFSVFMAENGISCLTDHQGDILNCLNTTEPELFAGNFQKTRWKSYQTFLIFVTDDGDDAVGCSTPVGSGLTQFL